MSNLARLAITCVAALLVGAYTYADAFVDYSGILDAVYSGAASGWIVFGLPPLTVVLVNRWWALSVALVPFAVLYYLHTATDYVYPYHEDPYPAITLFGTVFLLAISSLGFLLRAAFDRFNSRTCGGV